MNIHYLINIQGYADGVLVPLALWQRILEKLEQSPESATLLTEIAPLPPQVRLPQNPLKILLESNFIGCFEAEATLSENYKAEFGEQLETKYAHR